MEVVKRKEYQEADIVGLTHVLQQVAILKLVLQMKDAVNIKKSIMMIWELVTKKMFQIVLNMAAIQMHIKIQNIAYRISVDRMDVIMDNGVATSTVMSTVRIE